MIFNYIFCSNNEEYDETYIYICVWVNRLVIENCTE